MPNPSFPKEDPTPTPEWFLGTGAFLLIIFFILFISELGRVGLATESVATNLQQFLKYYNFVLTPLLVVVAGSLGAYSQLTRNFVTRIVAVGRTSGSRSTVERREPALLYLVVGALFGFLGGLVIPSALLMRDVDLARPRACELCTRGRRMRRDECGSDRSCRGGPCVRRRGGGHAFASLPAARTLVQKVARRRHAGDRDALGSRVPSAGPPQCDSKELIRYQRRQPALVRG